MRKNEVKRVHVGKFCGHRTFAVYLPQSENKVTVQYCRVKSCANYYRCSCGLPFGQHNHPQKHEVA